MGRFDRGVAWYTRGHIELECTFPEDAICCRYCPFLRADANGARYKCCITGDILYGVDAVGDRCPIVIDKEDNNRERI